MASLVSVEQAKQYLGISSSDQDALLEAMIEHISAEVERRCGRPFTRRSFVETILRARADAYVVLRQRPVLAITRVTDDATGAAIDPEDVVVDAEAGIVHLPQRVRQVTIEYDAGYDVTPPDVQGAVLAIVAAVWQDRTRSASQLAIGDYRAAIELAMPQVADILDRYPRDVVV